jgi:hypothetical protein
MFLYYRPLCPLIEKNLLTSIPTEIVHRVYHPA